jgi:hypothetical protein
VNDSERLDGSRSHANSDYLVVLKMSKEMTKKLLLSAFGGISMHRHRLKSEAVLACPFRVVTVYSVFLSSFLSSPLSLLSSSVSYVEDLGLFIIIEENDRLNSSHALAGYRRYTTTTTGQLNN